MGADTTVRVCESCGKEYVPHIKGQHFCDNQMCWILGLGRFFLFRRWQVTEKGGK